MNMEHHIANVSVHLNHKTMTVPDLLKPNYVINAD